MARELSPPLDLVSIVEEFNGVSSKEISKLLNDSESFIIQFNNGRGSVRLIDVEKLATTIPLHLIAVLLSSDPAMRLAHLLRGVRLLHSLCDSASRHARLEQVLLDDVKISEQLIDLVFFMLIVLAQTEQDYGVGTSVPPLHSTLVACTLHLLTGYISSQWHELVHVLLSHPKVDIFMDVAFDAVHAAIRLLYVKLSALDNEIRCKSSSLHSAERTAIFLCQQCEVSLQFLLSLCQQKLFRDRLLKNKELCKNGGLLSLSHTILKLKVPANFVESPSTVAAVSRLKSKVLSILLQLCEAETVSYLDEVAGSSKSMSLAKYVALEILDLLNAAFKKEVNQGGKCIDRSNPKGLVLLNSLHLADIYSDDSNFRSFFMTNAIHVLIEILAIPHEVFQSSWCSADVPMVEEDVNLEYDPFIATGVALLFLSSDCESALSAPDPPNENNFGCHSNINGAIPSLTYAQQKSSYLVKIIANLHCFVPNICEEEERNLFLNKFHERLCMEASESLRYPSNFKAQKAATICKNLSSLSDHAAPLIPNLLNDEDVTLLRDFTDQLKKLIRPQIDDSLIQNIWGSIPSTLGVLDVSYQGESPNFKGELDQHVIIIKPENQPDSVATTRAAAETLKEIEKENQKFDTKDAEPNSANGEVDLISDIGEPSKAADYVKESGFPDDEKIDCIQGEEKQPRKRKRNIMSDRQINLIEQALLDEPEMQRNSALLQSWADTLSGQGSEITPSQLKNWLNNRKARLARAAREARAPSEGENAYYADKSCGPGISHFYDSPDSASEEPYVPPSRTGALGNPSTAKCSRMPGAEDHKTNPQPDSSQHGAQSRPLRAVDLKPGQLVTVVDVEGNEVGRGKLFQVEGRWQGKNLEDVGVCIVDIAEFKVERSMEVQYPSEGGGRTFEEAVARNGGVARVAWDVDLVHHLPH